MLATVKQFTRHWLGVLKQAVEFWLDSNAFANAGSLAFFTLFSIAPVVIVIVSIIGFVFGQEAAEGQIAAQLQETLGPEAAQAVQTAVAKSSLKACWPRSPGSRRCWSAQRPSSGRCRTR